MIRSNPTISIRSAVVADLKAVHAIQTYYVTKTLLNFAYEPETLEEVEQNFERIVKDGYDFLVATQINNNQSSSDSPTETIVGYAYVHSFRTRAAYQHTGELSIFCDSEYTDRGIGGMLLEGILSRLKSMKQIGGHAEFGKRKIVHQLLACMTVDPDPVKAEKLRRFYDRFGFREVALLKKVGWKQGMWLDTRYMQLEI